MTRLHEHGLRLPPPGTEGNASAPNRGGWTVRDLGKRVRRGHLDELGPLRAGCSPWFKLT